MQSHDKTTKYLTLRYFTAADAVALAADCMEPDLKNVAEHAAYNIAAGPAYSGFYNGRLVVAAGIRKHANGSGTPWLLMGRGAMTCKTAVWRSVRMMLEILIAECGFTRLRTHSLVGFAASQRVLEHLGFQKKRMMLNGTHYYYCRNGV